MKIINRFFLLLVFLLLPVLARAEIILEAPGKMARGDAFVATAKSSDPIENFIFFWKGKTYPIKAYSMGNNLWEGQILLPVPLDEKAKRLSLGVGAGKDKSIPAMHVDIALFDRKRPEQRLTVDKKYVEPPASEKERIKKDREKVRIALGDKLPEKMWTLPLQRPVPGTVSSLFGMKRVFNGQPRSVHKGLDLRGASGTPIKACSDGRVALVDNLYFSGNTVYLNHGDGVFSAYLHMSKPLVQTGQYVKKGDVIGLVGATGRVTGPHLHLSMIVQGQSVDPEPLLEASKKTK